MVFDQRRRDVLKATGGAGLLLAGGVGTAAARMGAREGASGDQTIVDIATAINEETGEFSTLIAALTEAGLVGALDGRRQLTAFAPTDAAFAAIDVDENNVDTVPGLANILLYHVTEGRRYASSVVRAPRIGMLNGEDVTVDGTELNGGQAEIVQTDVEASNGVIHVIDGVLLPPE